MDLHQKTSTFSVKEREGRVIEAKTVPTTKESIEEFLSPYQGSLLTMEPVSQWYCYADYIEELGLSVKIANPMRVKAIASARIKTDTIDAGVLADLLRANMLPESYHAPADVRAWKEEVRLRMSLVRLRVQVKNKIHALLWKQGIRAPYTLFSKRGLRWLDTQIFSKEITIALATYRETLALLERQVTDAEVRMIEDNKHREEVKLLITIPVNPEYSSLNLAAAVQVVSYELRTCGIVTEPISKDFPPAAFEDVERLYEHLERTLIEIDFLDPLDPRRLMTRLRRLFARAGMEREEVNILRGILTKACRGRIPK